MDTRLRLYLGQVISHAYAPGSKSAHEAVCLRTSAGKLFRLRRPSGPPFHDPELQTLLGKNIRCHGRQAAGQTLDIESWDVLPGPPQG